MIRKDSGVTLVELLTVIGILGIVAAISIPAYMSYLPDIRLKAAARDIKSDLGIAKIRAIRENKFVSVVFNTGNNSYTVFVDDGTGGTAGDGNRTAGEVLVKSVPIPENVTMYEAGFSGGAGRTRFNGRGLPGGFIGHVYMRNTNNNYRGVALSIVGHVQIKTSSDNGGSWQNVD